MSIIGAVVGAIIGLILAPIMAVSWGLAAAFLPLPPIALGFSLGATAAVVIYLVIVVVVYVLAVIGTSLTQASVGLQTPSGVELFARGTLIGLNALMNVFLLPTAFAVLALPWSPVGPAAALALPLAIVMGPVVGVIGILSAIPSTSNSPAYQVMLAWFGLAMPMSWPMILLGAVVWLLNLLLFWLLPLNPFTDFTSATLVTNGGWVYFPFPAPSAYNLGAFVQIPGYIQRTTPGQWLNNGVSGQTANGLALHEGAHNFSLAAMGWWFHLIGFIHEGLLPGPGFVWPSGKFAYAELLPEGRLRGATNPWLPVWTPSLNPPAPGNVPPALGECDVFTTVPAVGTPVQLTTTTAATDADGYVHAIGLLWVLTKPATSVAAIAAPNAANTTFTPDVSGVYSASLFVSDGADGGPVPVAVGGANTVTIP